MSDIQKIYASESPSPHTLFQIIPGSITFELVSDDGFLLIATSGHKLLLRRSLQAFN